MGNVSILMGVRRFAPNAGKLDFPGGFVLPREDVGHAAAREVFEEFGVRIRPEECTLLDCLHELYGAASGIPVFNCGLACVVAPQQRPSAAQSGTHGGAVFAVMDSDLAPMGARDTAQHGARGSGDREGDGVRSSGDGGGSQWVDARSIKRADFAATRGNARLFDLFLKGYEVSAA